MWHLPVALAGQTLRVVSYAPIRRISDAPPSPHRHPAGLVAACRKAEPAFVLQPRCVRRLRACRNSALVRWLSHPLATATSSFLAFLLAFRLAKSAAIGVPAVR